MRRAPTALLVTATLVTGACSQVGQAVDQAAERADRVADTARYCAQAIEVAQAVANQDVDAAVESGEELVELAPPEVADEARILLEAAQRAQGGDTQALQSEEVVVAAQRVRETTQAECNPADRE